LSPAPYVGCYGIDDRYVFRLRVDSVTSPGFDASVKSFRAGKGFDWFMADQRIVFDLDSWRLRSGSRFRHKHEIRIEDGRAIVELGSTDGVWRVFTQMRCPGNSDDADEAAAG